MEVTSTADGTIRMVNANTNAMRALTGTTRWAMTGIVNTNAANRTMMGRIANAAAKMVESVKGVLSQQTNYGLELNTVCGTL